MFCISLFTVSLPNCSENVSEMERGEKEERDGKCCLCRDAFVICMSGEHRAWEGQGLFLHVKTGVWECSFSLTWRLFFSPVSATTFFFLSGWQNYPASLGRRLGTRNLCLTPHSLPVLPPLVPLAPVQAPEQASAFFLLCHPTVPSRSRRHCAVQAASWVTGTLP